MIRSAVCMVVLLVSLPLAAGDTTKVATDTKQASIKAGVPAKPKGPVMITTDSGLKYMDTVIGTGVSPQKGQTCSVHYTGWLTSGKKFDSSIGKAPFQVTPLGSAPVIKGWNEGVVGMKVGGKRQLRIPPDLAYGAGGYPGVIPPNATLIFDVQLVGIQ